MAVRAYPFTATGQVGPQYPATAAATGGVAGQGGYATLVGWSLHETGGTTDVTVTITDGGVSGGVRHANILVPKGTSKEIFLGPQGLQFSVGAYATVSGGTLSGDLWFS